jgi:transcriptional regulator with XRE-family HTH domain
MSEKPSIKELMAAAKVTQQELADRLGVKQSTVSGMLNPKTDLRLSTLKRLSRAMGVSLETLAATYDDPEDIGGDSTNN